MSDTYLSIGIKNGDLSRVKEALGALALDTFIPGLANNSKIHVDVQDLREEYSKMSKF